MKYYDTNEIKKKLGISRQAVAKAVKAGKIKPYKGKQFIFTEEEVNRFMEKYYKENLLDF